MSVDAVVTGLANLDFDGAAHGARRSFARSTGRADRLMRRRLVARELHQLIEVRYAACRTGGDRARREGVDANAARAHFSGQIPHGAFERRLDRPHHVVMRNDFLAAVVGRGQQAAAVSHQRFGQARHADEGVARDVHRLEKALPRSVGHTACKIALGRIGNGMKQEIELSPIAFNGTKHRFRLRVIAHVQRKNEGCFNLLGQRAHEGLGLVVEIRDCQ